jgi:hypothetical protein
VRVVEPLPTSGASFPADGTAENKPASDDDDLDVADNMVPVETVAEVADATKIDKEVQEEEQRRRAADNDALAKAADVEFKPGDYQIHVHVIMAKDLKGEDSNGLSDPVVEVSTFGQTRCTRVHKKVTTCVFDETFVFMLPGLRVQEVEQGTIKVLRSCLRLLSYVSDRSLCSAPVFGV